VNGTPVTLGTGGSYTISNIVADQTVTVEDVVMNTYTVTWLVDGNVTTENYAYGSTPSFTGSTYKAPTAQYTYTFTGFSPAISEVTDNVTYTARYSQTLNDYTVTFESLGSIIATVDGVEIQSGDSVKWGMTVLFTISFEGQTGIDADWYVTVNDVLDKTSYVGVSLTYVISGDTSVYAEIHTQHDDPASTMGEFLWWTLLIILAAILIGSYVYLRHRSGA